VPQSETLSAVRNSGTRLSLRESQSLTGTIEQPCSNGNTAQQNHWSECGRAASVDNSDALDRPHRSVLALDHNRTPMTLHLSYWRVGAVVFGAFGLLLFSATLFFFVSDDFVIRGQVVPGSDARFVPWRLGLSVAGLFSVLLAWLCHRQSRRALWV
jgi:hypothetical protein